jgi:hypothetical protein
MVVRKLLGERLLNRTGSVNRSQKFGRGTAKDFGNLWAIPDLEDTVRVQTGSLSACPPAQRSSQ